LDSLQKQLDSLRSKKADTVKITVEIAKLAGQKCTDAEIKGLQDNVTRLPAMLASIKDVTGLINRLPAEGDLAKILIFLEGLVKNSSEDLVRLDINANGVDLYMKIRSNDSALSAFSLRAIVPVEIQQFIPVIGKALVNFSVGPFGGIPKHLENETYAWQPLANNQNMIPSNPNYILAPSGYTHPAVGIAAMANVEWKCYRKSLGLGISGGAGVSLEMNPRLAGLLGGSLYLGNRRQLVITGGLAAMSIDRLTDNWQTIADKQIIYTTQPAISYYKELLLGGFVSLTFTPFPLSKY